MLVILVRIISGGGNYYFSAGNFTLLFLLINDNCSSDMNKVKI